MNICIDAWGSTGEHVPVAALCGMLGERHAVRVLASAAHRESYAVPAGHFHALQSIDLTAYSGIRLDVTGELVRRFIDPLS